MVGWGLAVLAMAFVQNGIQLVVLRFLLGVFEAGFLPGVYILTSIWFKGKNHGVAMSGVMIGLAVTTILGGPCSGWVLGTHFLGLSGWWNLFLIDGVFTAAWALLAWCLVDDAPERASWLKPTERKFMSNYLAEYQAQKVVEGAVEKSSLWETLKDRRIIMLLAGYCLTGWVSSTFLYFIPTLLKRAGTGLSNQAVGFLAMGPGIAWGFFSHSPCLKRKRMA